MNQRFSDRYPGMIPMRCFYFNGKEFCLLRIGSTYGYPIMLHFGTNQNFPKRCNWYVLYYIILLYYFLL